MGKMVSLAMSKKEAKAELGGSFPSAQKDADLPRYPYGTSLRLETETLKKLGIDLSDYPLGAECEIMAKGVVTDTSQSQRLGGKERLNLEIQITDVSITESAASKKKKAGDKHLNDIGAPSSVEDTDEY